MVNDVGIGYGQQHPCRSNASFAIQDVLKKNNIWVPQGIGFGVHAVVSGDADGCTQLIKPLEIAVHHGVETIGASGARCMLVLHVVCGRQVHQVRPQRFQQHDAGRKYEL